MFSTKLRPLQGCALYNQVCRSSVSHQCSRLPIWSPRRLASNLNKSPFTRPRSILAKQRLNRPVSPHLTIYKPQITWIVSIATRITGVALSGGLYLYATAYLLSPTVTGWDIGSKSLVNAFGSLSPVSKFALKFAVALPFSFHSFNGVRHLIWDTGSMLTNQQVARSGWTVVGASVVAAFILASWRPVGVDRAVQ